MCVWVSSETVTSNQSHFKQNSARYCNKCKQTWPWCTVPDGHDAQCLMALMHSAWCPWCTVPDVLDAQCLMAMMHSAWWPWCTVPDGHDAQCLMALMHSAWWPWCTVPDGHDAQCLMRNFDCLGKRNFTEIRPVGARLIHAGWRTDKHKTKLTTVQWSYKAMFWYSAKQNYARPISTLQGSHGGCSSNNGLLHRALIKYADVSEERTACIFRVNELVPMDAEVILRNQIQTLLDSWTLKMGPTGCPETSVITTTRCVTTQTSAVLI